ncbi:hypothetical protein G6N76_21830 [Rhizobium daejeonense]|uniref:Uncharacterized protein n=1 Tax=Rhizobium daejeonense TaxID=240521 RepID=A0A6M1S9Z6_9HYPH|nr:hypothetical protein [Rhizobium daejeonense]NGO66307.1 hypothetical protein [Rhizobium daejeonense]
MQEAEVSSMIAAICSLLGWVLQLPGPRPGSGSQINSKRFQEDCVALKTPRRFLASGPFVKRHQKDFPGAALRPVEDIITAHHDTEGQAEEALPVTALQAWTSGKA